MDGRIQLPVITYLHKHFQAEFVDSITEPGPNGILAAQQPQSKIESILGRLDISVNNHQSVGIAIVGHHECAGNPTPKADQIGHIKQAVAFIRKNYEKLEVIGLWVNENREVEAV